MIGGVAEFFRTVQKKLIRQLYCNRVNIQIQEYSNTVRSLITTSKFEVRLLPNVFQKKPQTKCKDSGIAAIACMKIIQTIEVILFLRAALFYYICVNMLCYYVICCGTVTLWCFEFFLL